MNGGRWVKAPTNAAAEWWMTRRDCRTVLVVVPHLQAGTRLLDVLPVLEADHRVQVMFTVPSTSDYWDGVEEFLRGIGGLVLPWHQVLRSEFDLALAASYQGISAIRAPVVVLPHGASSVKSRLSPWTDDGAFQPVHGLERELLIRDGRIVPASLVLCHDSELAVLQESCPEALPRAVVVGDPCYDRMLAGVPLRQTYREALGAQPGQTLVVVSTTWSPHSLIGTDPGAFARLISELPSDEYRVVAIVHPSVWAGHGAWQVRTWLADALRAGMSLLPPEEGWRGAVVAADVVVGDHGSVTQYAAALGVPVLMSSASDTDVRPGSIAALMRSTSTPFLPDRPVRSQLDRARAEHSPESGAAVAERISSQPGQSASILRRLLYGLLRMPEPDRVVRVAPVPLPTVEPSL